MKFSHRKHYYMKIYNMLIEVVHKYFFRENWKVLYFKRQWSQLHAQVDPKKFMKIFLKWKAIIFMDTCF